MNANGGAVGKPPHSLLPLVRQRPAAGSANKPVSGAFTTGEANQIQRVLRMNLGKKDISYRAGPSGTRLAYLTYAKLVELTNNAFGFNGWNSDVRKMTVDYIEQDATTLRWQCMVTCFVRITLRDGTYHEDIGIGDSANIKSRVEALGNSKKSAVTDAMKRTLRHFGNYLGGTLADKQHMKMIYNGKVPYSVEDENAPPTKYVRDSYDDVAGAQQMLTAPVSSGVYGGGGGVGGGGGGGGVGLLTGPPSAVSSQMAPAAATTASAPAQEWYYAVHKGFSPGVYDTYAEVKDAIAGYPDHKYRRFSSMEDAAYFVMHGSTPPKASVTRLTPHTSTASNAPSEQRAPAAAAVTSTTSKSAAAYSNPTPMVRGQHGGNATATSTTNGAGQQQLQQHIAAEPASSANASADYENVDEAAMRNALDAFERSTADKLTT